MTQNTKVLVAGIAGLVVVAGAVLLLGGTGGGGAGTTTAESAEGEPPQLPTTIPPHAFLAAHSLSSPEKALETEVRALMAKQEPAFRTTLGPAAAPTLTPEMFEACVARVRSGPLAPMWADVETTDGGVHLRQATLAGGAKATFREVRGRWFADSVWCNAPLQPAAPAH